MGADVGGDDPDIVEQKALGTAVDHIEDGAGLGGGDNGSGGEVVHVVEQEGPGDGVAQQEVGDGGLGQVGLGEGLVIGHEESDVGLKEVWGGHVDEHGVGKVVGSLHLSHSHGLVS